MQQNQAAAKSSVPEVDVSVDPGCLMFQDDRLWLDKFPVLRITPSTNKPCVPESLRQSYASSLVLVKVFQKMSPVVHHSQSTGDQKAVYSRQCKCIFIVFSCMPNSQHMWDTASYTQAGWLAGDDGVPKAQG